MEFFEAVSRRRSVRNYSDKPVPAEVVNRALDAALLAPNSSNMQTWRMYWVKDPARKSLLKTACMNQGAARTAQELLVFTAHPADWRTTRALILEALKNESRKDLRDYYTKLMPLLYGYQWLAPLKWLLLKLVGFFRPMPREVASLRDRREVAVKSCALACENFMLAIAAQGFDSCPMEGFDSVRVRRALGLSRRETVVMVISVGERTERGVWGERFRVARDVVVREI